MPRLTYDFATKETLPDQMESLFSGSSEGESFRHWIGNSKHCARRGWQGPALLPRTTLKGETVPSGRLKRLLQESEDPGEKILVGLPLPFLNLRNVVGCACVGNGVGRLAL